MIFDVSSEQVTIDHLHHKIHDSCLFYFYDRQVAITATQEYLFRTGSKPVHARFTLTSSVSTLVDILEGVTTSATGTSITVFNHDRTSSRTPLSLIYKGPTYTGGTTIKQNIAGSGNNPGQATTSAAGVDIEYVLKPNTDYVLKHAPSASANCMYIGTFYESKLVPGA